MICICTAELNELELIYSLDMVWIFYYNLSGTLLYEDAFSIQHLWDCLCFNHLGLMGWVTDAAFISKEYTLKAWCPKLMCVPGTGHNWPHHSVHCSFSDLHWDGTPRSIYTYHMTPDDENTESTKYYTWTPYILTGLTARKDYTATSQMYCTALLLKLH